ncbi:MAG: flagellar motor switch protein FliN [Planctomycetota bacterium]|nr:flagellar motor switch protein FliN [Planctomycetota bacterium]
MSETVVNNQADTRAVPLHPNDLPSLNPSKSQGEAIGLDHLMDVTVPLTVELGRTRISIAGLSQFAPGSLVTLEREAHENVDVLVNGKLVAKGEVVTVGARYGVRITKMIST